MSKHAYDVYYYVEMLVLILLCSCTYKGRNTDYERRPARLDASAPAPGLSHPSGYVPGSSFSPLIRRLESTGLANCQCSASGNCAALHVYGQAVKQSCVNRREGLKPRRALHWNLGGRPEREALNASKIARGSEDCGKALRLRKIIHRVLAPPRRGG